MATEEELKQQIISEKLEKFEAELRKNSRNHEIKTILKNENQIVEQAKQLIAKYYRESNVSIRPKSIFAAAMYISCIENEKPIVQERMARIFDSNVVSTRRACREILSEQDYERITKHNYKIFNWMKFKNNKKKNKGGAK